MVPWEIDSLLHGYAIFLRASAFLFLLPFMGRPVPVLVRGAAAFFLAFFFVPLTSVDPSLEVPRHLIDLLGLSLKEVFIGFCMGFGVQITFYLCEVAGRLLSMEMGLMQSNLFNPLMGEQATVLATGMSLLSVVLVFTLEIHHFILYAFKQSLVILPPGAVLQGGMTGQYVVNSIGNIFLLAVQISAPLIAVNFIITLAFAILGRAVPNLNVLILSFGARIFGGFVVLILVFVVVVQFLLLSINDIPERMLQFLPFR